MVQRQIEKFSGCGGSNRKHGNILIGDTPAAHLVLKAKAGAFAGKTLYTAQFVLADGLTPVTRASTTCP